MPRGTQAPPDPERGCGFHSHADELGPLTVFGNSSPELTRIVASAHASPLTRGTNEIPLPQSTRSFLSYISRESETNPTFIIGFDHVR